MTPRPAGTFSGCLILAVGLALGTEPSRASSAATAAAPIVFAESEKGPYVDRGGRSYGLSSGYTWDVDEKHFQDYARPIDEYIRTRYAIEARADGYEIWRRIEGATRGTEAWPAACRPRRFRLGDLM